MEFSLPHRTDVEEWTVEQVAAWLKEKEMVEAADVFLRKGIDGHQMLNLKEESILIMGKELRLRLRIDLMKLINQLKSLPSAPQRSQRLKSKAVTTYAPNSISVVKNAANTKSEQAPKLPTNCLDEAAYLVPLSYKPKQGANTKELRSHIPHGNSLKKPSKVPNCENSSETKTHHAKKTPPIRPPLPSVGPPVSRKPSRPLLHKVQHSEEKQQNVRPEKTQTEFLRLGETKRVPMCPLYKSLLNKDFFHPVTRKLATNLLTKHGTFVIRPSTHTENPLTLTIMIRGEVCHISIRQRSDNQFALGTPKNDEKCFSTIEELVSYHKHCYIKKDSGATALLLQTPPKVNN